MQERRNIYISISKKNIGNEEYQKIYNFANDSINMWIFHSLKNYRMQKYALEWQLDSLICFDSELNKCIMLIMNRESETVSNSINYLYGVKIDNSWYFFRGPTVYFFSERYDLPPNTPLSFEKMKEITTKSTYRGYLKKGKKRKWEINKQFFQDLTSVAWCTDCITQEDWDKRYLSIIRENWQKRDTTNYE